MKAKIPLIDSFVDSMKLFPNGWYIAKPIFHCPLFCRVLHAWSVLIGEAYAITFYEDTEEQRQNNEIEKIDMNNTDIKEWI